MLSLSTVVLNIRDRYGFQIFHTLKNNLAIGFSQKTQLKALVIDTTVLIFSGKLNILVCSKFSKSLGCADKMCFHRHSVCLREAIVVHTIYLL